MKKYLIWGIWAVAMGAIVTLALPKAQASISQQLPTQASSNKWVMFGVAGAVVAGGAYALKTALSAAKLKA